MSDLIILDEQQEDISNISTDIQDDQIQTESLQTKTNVSFMERLNAIFLSLQSIKIKEKVIFYRLLSTMLNAGMPLLKGVWVLERQEKTCWDRLRSL